MCRLAYGNNLVVLGASADPGKALGVEVFQKLPVIAVDTVILNPDIFCVSFCGPRVIPQPCNKLTLLIRHQVFEAGVCAGFVDSDLGIVQRELLTQGVKPGAVDWVARVQVIFQRGKDKMTIAVKL